MKKIFLLSIYFIFCLNIFSQQVKDTSASDISYGIFKDLEFSKEFSTFSNYEDVKQEKIDFFFSFGGDGTILNALKLKN